MRHLSGFPGVTSYVAQNTGFGVTAAHLNFLFDCTATAGTLVVALPDCQAVGNGFAVHILRNAASDSNVQLDGYLSQTVQGAATYDLTDDWQIVRIVSDGTGNWTVDQGGGGGTPGADEKVKVTSSDTTTDYLNNKVSAGTGISLAVASPGGDETLQITNSDTGSGAVGSHTSTYDHTKLHDRQHSITSTADHTSTATSGKMLKADANGLPTDATNTDAEVSAAVTASHAKQHSVTSTADHTSTATAGKILKADANGLPVDASNTDSQVSAAVTASHARSHAIDSTSDHTSAITSGNLISANANGLPADSAITASSVSSAVSASHARQHSVTSSSDHTSTATAGKMLKADANGLPVDATNTDTEVAATVSASHARSHSITSSSDHTSTATPGKMLKADANGLPVDATNTDSQVAAAVTASHAAATVADTNSVNMSITGQQISADVIVQNTTTVNMSIDGSGVKADVNQAAIDHTSIANRGTNTHSQIDSHIGSTANPHSVTASQVGLGNVTNDAQIPKSIGDAKGDIIVYTADNTPTRLPAGADGTVLKANSGTATGLEWGAGGGGGTPGGSDTQVQFNDGGAFGGDADLTWNKTTNTLKVENDGVATGGTTIIKGKISGSTGGYGTDLELDHTTGGKVSVQDLKLRISAGHLYENQILGVTGISAGTSGNVVAVSPQDKVNVTRKLLLDDFTATATASMTVLPSAEATAWTASAGGGTEGGYCSVSGGIMTLDTTGVSAGTMQYSRAPGVNFANGFTYELKWMAETISGTALVGYVRDNTNSRYINIYSNGAVNKWGISDGASYRYFTCDMSYYRTWRLVVVSTSVYYLIIDDEVRVIGVPSTSAVADAVGFGDATNTAGVNVKLKYDYVSYALSVKANNYSKFRFTADNLMLGSHATGAVSHTLDTANAAGALGIDTGSFTTATWYAVWELFGDAGATAVFSLSTTFAGVTKPSGGSYDYAFGRIVAWVYTDGTTATDFRYCQWFNDGFVFYGKMITVLYTATPATAYTEVSFAPVIPPGWGTYLGLVGVTDTSSTLAYLQLSVDASYTVGQYVLQTPTGNIKIQCEVMAATTSERTMFYRTYTTNDVAEIYSMGYYHVI